MKFQAVDSIEVPNVVLLPFQKGKVDFELIRQYTGASNDPDFQGSFKQMMGLFHVSEPIRVFLIGLGEEKDQPKVHEAFRWITHKRNNSLLDGMFVETRHLTDDQVGAISLGMSLATYQLGTYKSEEKELPAVYSAGFQVKVATKASNQSLLDEGNAAAESMKQIMALVDAPGNVKTPTFLAEWAQNSAEAYGYQCEVLTQSELEEQGFDALLAVGQGSQHDSVLIKVEHKPYGLTGNAPKVGLVGKGITFDTGGLSIKPSANMHYMKSDMGGAAAVLGAVELAAKLKLPIHVVGMVASAENAVDAHSVKPGDVIGSHSGKSIEVIDTDAEGRLALADGLSHMIKAEAPDYLIDLATLTGSTVRTFAYTAAAMFTHDDDFAALVSEAGNDLHERAWRLPLYDDFDADLHSDIADVRNFSGKPVAGAITAAKFLEFFVEDHPHWMHLDIAGVAFGDNAYAKMKSASGYGVRLLVEVMKRLIEQSQK